MFRFPCRFLLKDVQFDIKQKDGLAGVSIDEIYAEYALFSSKRDLRIYVGNLTGEFPPCKVNNLHLNSWIRFDSPKGPAIDGNLAIKAVDFYNFSTTRVLATLKGRDGTLDFFRVFADSYDGRILGEIFLDYLSGMSYSINLKLTDIDLRRMRNAYREVFSQIDGRLNGYVTAKGRMDKVTFLKADLDIPAGGKLKAALLAAIAGYLPQSTQKKELELLIAANGEVPFEDGKLSVQSVSDDQLATTVALKSQKFNLDMNVGVDINLDGGFQNLFQYMQKTFKQ